MGHWGVRSYENDDAHDALDAGFDRARGAEYERLMDDRNPLTIEQVQERLAGPDTLAAALDWLREEFGADPDAWDDEARLAHAGVVVRHAELGVPIPPDDLARAIAVLDSESLDWERDRTRREVRRRNEVALLRRAPSA